LNAGDGLSQGTIYSILQDSKGFMWFGTMGGLNKYDGNRFTVYRNQPGNPNSIPNNIVRSLHEDGNGTLWMLTDSGLACFDPKSEIFRFFRHPTDKPGNLNSHGSLYEDSSGGMCYLKRHRDWVRFDPIAETFSDCTLKSDSPGRKINRIIRIHKGRNGILWFGTRDNGLVKSDEKTGKTTTYRHNPDNPHSIPGNTVIAIHQSRSGKVWLCVWQKGLAVFDPEKKIFTTYPYKRGAPKGLSHPRVHVIHEARNGAIWVGTRYGLNMLDTQKRTFTPFYVEPENPGSISDNGIYSICQDRSGILWFGTMGSGIDTLELNRRKFSHYRHVPGEENSLSSDIVRGFCEDRTGKLWIA
ncbi:MAG: hypothetical protein GY757_34990, partial [bacterium]|nr:hypothetical protein [bacterium]